MLVGIAKLNGETSTMGEALIAKQEELYARSEQKMMEFQSKSGAAWAEMNKTAQDRLDETVVEVVNNYDEMVAKGSYAAEAMEEQYIKMVTKRLETCGFMALRTHQVKVTSLAVRQPLRTS